MAASIDRALVALTVLIRALRNAILPKAMRNGGYGNAGRHGADFLAQAVSLTPAVLTLLLAFMLQACGGDPSDGAADRSAGHSLSSTASATYDVAPGPFAATVTVAPPDGTTLSGFVKLEVRGSGLGNVELLPADAYLPIWAAFTLSDDRTIASLDLDTRILPNGPIRLRISAFNRPAGDPTASEIIAMPARTWNINNAASSFTAAVANAPADGATISGVVTLEVRGSGMANVELLPPNSYTPRLGVFTLSDNGTVARFNFDTRFLPNGPIQLRISAFDKPAGDPSSGEVVAMPPRTWIVSNTAPVTGPPNPGPSSLPANVATVTVKRSPRVLDFNRPFVQVTVCEPNSPNCQTIDDILLDTGSSGLRLLASALDPRLSFPAVTDDSGRQVGHCTIFGGGQQASWGAVRKADLKLGAMEARDLSVEIVNEPAFTPVPGDCRNRAQRVTEDFGFNGVLGIGMVDSLCGSACENGIPSHPLYYGCNDSACAGTRLPINRQVRNPIVLFASDYNNGSALTFPRVESGSTEPVVGTITFGIGTQANNQLGNAKIFRSDNSGLIAATYRGVRTAALLDTGSSYISFYDPDLPRCPPPLSHLYCPGSGAYTVTAINESTTGVRDNVTVNIISPASNQPLAVAPYGRATASGERVTWGLPFYFGRTIFTAIEGRNTPAGPGPYIAY